MQDLVSQAIARRVDEPDGLRRMLVLSLAAHIVSVAVLLLLPENWRLSRDDEPRTVMTISLGGVPGPRTGGMTPIGGRPVQQAVPEPPRPAPITPPAEKPPEMTVPIEKPKAAPAKPAPKPVQQAPDSARAQRPTTGPQVKEGNTVAQTPAEGRSVGLSMGGGGTGGQISVGNFCCPDYIQAMLQIIQRNWRQNQGTTAVTVMQFTILRDGTLSNVRVQKSSGYPNLDMAAQRALMATRLPSLPAEYPHPQLEVDLGFHYIP
jgi:TonB family protein